MLPLFRWSLLTSVLSWEWLNGLISRLAQTTITRNVAPRSGMPGVAAKKRLFEIVREAAARLPPRSIPQRPRLLPLCVNEAPNPYWWLRALLWEGTVLRCIYLFQGCLMKVWFAQLGQHLLHELGRLLLRMWAGRESSQATFALRGCCGLACCTGAASPQRLVFVAGLLLTGERNLLFYYFIWSLKSVY